MCGIYSAQKRQDICQKRTDFILLHGGHKYRLGSNTVNSLPCKKKNSDESFDSSLFCLACRSKKDILGNRMILARKFSQFNANGPYVKICSDQKKFSRNHKVMHRIFLSNQQT